MITTTEPTTTSTTIASVCGNGIIEPGEECDSGSCCSSTCQIELDGTPCDDGDICTDGDECISGTCTGGDPLTCNDSNPCTTDSCTPFVGCASIPVPDGTSTGNICGVGACQSNAVCLDGAENCTPGFPTPEICNDGIDNDCDGITDENECTP